MLRRGLRGQALWTERCPSGQSTEPDLKSHVLIPIPSQADGLVPIILYALLKCSKSLISWLQGREEKRRHLNKEGAVIDLRVFQSTTICLCWR